MTKQAPLRRWRCHAGGAVAAADVTDEVWDHVLLGAPAPRECALPAGLLARMRREFSFWYPFDLRVRRPGFSG